MYQRLDSSACNGFMSHVHGIRLFFDGAEDDYQLLINRISADFQRNPDVSSLMNRYDSIDGRFRDIDYISTSQTAWQPREHLMRINVFVYAFTHGGN